METRALFGKTVWIDGFNTIIKEGQDMNIDQLNNNVSFMLGDMYFEYNKEKNAANIRKHGISFELAARAFLDYNRIEMYDEDNSEVEDRYDTIGSTRAGFTDTTIGGIAFTEDVLFVVYTERIRKTDNGTRR